MKRVWFNKTFSSVHSAFPLIRRGDVEGRYRLLCTHPNPNSLAVRFAHEAEAEPVWLAGEEYVDWCVGFCRDRRVDIFVPGKEAGIVGRNAQRFLDHGVRVLSAAAPDTLESLHDKARFYAEACAPTAPSPEFEVFETAESFNAAYNWMRERHNVLCIKPAVSVYGIGFRQISETKSAFDIMLEGNPYRIDLTSLREMLQRAGHFRPMLLMPYLGGHEFSVDCVALEGDMVCAVARRKPAGAERGQTIVVRQDIDEACRHLVRQFALTGNVNIQFREGAHGLRILEINPRLSGGVAMACLAGPNLPYLALVAFDQGRDAATPGPIEQDLLVGEINHAIRLA